VTVATAASVEHSERTFLVVPSDGMELAFEAADLVRVIGVAEWNGTPPVDLQQVLGVRLVDEDAQARLGVFRGPRGEVAVRLSSAVSIRTLSSDAILDLPSLVLSRAESAVRIRAVSLESAVPLLVLDLNGAHDEL
jgi:hypothetical protein